MFCSCISFTSQRNWIRPTSIYIHTCIRTSTHAYTYVHTQTSYRSMSRPVWPPWCQQVEWSLAPEWSHESMHPYATYLEHQTATQWPTVLASPIELRLCDVCPRPILILPGQVQGSTRAAARCWGHATGIIHSSKMNCLNWNTVVQPGDRYPMI